MMMKKFVNNKSNLNHLSKDKKKENVDQMYRGIFYNDSSEVQYYEFGAHFRYKDLYHQLEIIKEKADRQAHQNIIKNLLNTKKIKIKINKPLKKKNDSNNKNIINVINNNNFNLTNVNLNLNLNVNEPNSQTLLKQLKQIENKIRQVNSTAAPINQIFSRNINKKDSNKQTADFGFSSGSSCKSSTHRNLTLFNAIKRIQHNNTIKRFKNSPRTPSNKQKKSIELDLNVMNLKSSFNCCGHNINTINGNDNPYQFNYSTTFSNSSSASKSALLYLQKLNHSSGLVIQGQKKKKGIK